MQNLRSIFEAKSEIEKELDIVKKLKPASFELVDDVYNEKHYRFRWSCPNILSQFEDGYYWDLKYSKDPVVLELWVKTRPNTDRDWSTKKRVCDFTFFTYDARGEECTGERYSEDIPCTDTDALKLAVKFMKIICNDVESLRTFINHAWEPGYRTPSWGMSLNEICRKITGQKFF